MFGTAQVGPFPSDINPAYPGVYFTTPFPDAMGGGYAFWDGKKWNPYGNWGGTYYKYSRPWWWCGLTKKASQSPEYIKKPA